MSCTQSSFFNRTAVGPDPGIHSVISPDISLGGGITEWILGSGAEDDETRVLRMSGRRRLRVTSRTTIRPDGVYDRSEPNSMRASASSSG